MKRLKKQADIDSELIHMKHEALNRFMENDSLVTVEEMIQKFPDLDSSDLTDAIEEYEEAKSNLESATKNVIYNIKNIEFKEVEEGDPNDPY